jgi:putative transposase
MIRASSASKSELVKRSGISRATLYYKPKLPDKDWELKVCIEEVLREYPSYGHKRLAIHLKINKKRVLRVMHLFGIKPYRRRGKKPFKVNKNSGLIFPNLLRIEQPRYENHIWVAYISFQGKFIYVATVMDVYTRKIVGFSILANHSTALVVNALLAALQYNPRAVIFHSDNGSEYDSKTFITLLTDIGTQISRSHPGCPWENGYQESFYAGFKVDLGDPNRFENLGGLVCEIYRTIYTYNHSRIHTALKMSPREFAEMQKTVRMKEVEKVS